jgi:predicted metal-dependent phosphotriesterase family hydrolase
MTFVRTVLGDVDPAELGVTYAHEHLVIEPGRATDAEPELLLDDVDRMAAELSEAAAAGLATAVDAMPCNTGRNPAKLAELSRRTGVRIVASTGLHHERFYDAAHWSRRLAVDDLADLFVADIEAGIDVLDYGSPRVRRSPYRAGIVKVAGSEGGPSARDRPIFEAAAVAHGRSGVPILTHCEHGTGALEQARLLVDQGVAPEHVLLSHVDKVVDRGYHREIAATGAFVVHDQAFRWGDTPDGTLQLLAWAAEDDRLDRVLLATDGARQGYLRAYGGAPGLAYLLEAFTRRMAACGLDGSARARMFVTNPARALAFAQPQASLESPGTDDTRNR